MHAALAPADPRQPGGPSPGFSRVRLRRAVALLLFVIVWVLCCPLRSLPLCVSLVSGVCLRSRRTRLLCLTYPSDVFMLSVMRPLWSNFAL